MDSPCSSKATRPGGQGGNDIHLSCRNNPNDDLGWGAPRALGNEVNTATDEQASTFFQSDLLFTRGNPLLQQQDLYVAPMNRHGEIGGPAVPIAELNHPTVNDGAPSVRADGRELFYHRDAGASLNTASVEQQPSLSHDGRTLVWASNRPGGSGNLDIWTSTRTSRRR